MAALRATSEAVEPDTRIGERTSVEETLLLADWALDAGARIVEIDDADHPVTLTWPVGAAARHHRVLNAGS